MRCYLNVPDVSVVVGDEWTPFEYANSDKLVRFSLNPSTLRCAVERRSGGVPVL
jgi:hypothetical protein